MQPDSTQKTPKYPAVGCKRGYFVDTDSFRVSRGRVALFAGFARDETRPDRTASARLIAAADSNEELMASHPEAFTPSLRRQLALAEHQLREAKGAANRTFYERRVKELRREIDGGLDV